MIRSPEHVTAAFLAMDEGVVVQNAVGEIMLYNPAALRIVGVTEDQLLGKASFDPKWKAINEDGSLITPESHPAMVAQRTAQMVKRTVGFHRPNGEVCWIILTAVPQFEAGANRCHQVVITFRDITEERTSRRALEKAEAEISRLMNSIPALIGYWGPDLRNVITNQQYADLFCKNVEDFKGLHIQEAIGPALFDIARPHIEEALRGKAQSFEASFTDLRGIYRQFVVQYLPDFRDGQIAGFYTVATDISRLKKLENERREFESKFIAASKMSALGEMAAGIAHEINNPLAIINGKTAVLQERVQRGAVDADKFSKDLVVITETVERIAKTVRGLLSFSRNTESEEMMPTCLGKIINGTLDLCREKMRNRGVELRFSIQEPIELSCRANQVSQILMNLLNNAFDAISEQDKQWIEIDVSTLEHLAVIRVIDSGPKISDAVVAKLMQPFFTTKEIGKGTGLGLSISKGLAENHGGSLTYDSTHANTCFVLKIPRSQSKSSKVPLGA